MLEIGKLSAHHVNLVFFFTPLHCKKNGSLSNKYHFKLSKKVIFVFEYLKKFEQILFSITISNIVKYCFIYVI